MSITRSRKSLIDRLPLLLVLVGLLIISIWIGVIFYRSYAVYQSLNELQSVSHTLRDEGVAGLDIDHIEGLVLDARGDFVDLQNSTEPLLLLAPYFSWIPEVGLLLSSAPQLMEMADSGSQAAVELLAGLKPALFILQDMSGADPSSINQLLEILATAEPNINSALTSVEEMREARDEMGETSEFPWRVQTILDTFDKELPVIEDGLRLSTAIPELMGANGRRSYLIMAQNEDELRPTGGYISGAGLLVVEDGQIASIEFSDAGLVDDWRNKPYKFPPLPFYEIMGMDIFLFRDANFWPDFPTTALQAMDLYSYGQDIPVDGVIAIDQEFMKMLLSAVGPLFVPELERTLAANNVVSEMRSQWGPSPGSDGNWIMDRKSFMGPMADALRQRFEGEMSSIDLVDLIRSLLDAADQRHLQVYMRDPYAAEVLAETGWDGHFENKAGQDYLLVVDMSMGFNKVTAVVDREINYHVTLPKAGRPNADLVIQYAHTGQPSEVECQHGTWYTNQTRYTDLLDDCYWNYVRVYAPIGSELVGSSINPVSASHLLSGQEWEGLARQAPENSEKFEVFDNFYLIEQGQQFIGEINYLLPESVHLPEDDSFVYRLEVAKQAGIGPQPVRIRITLPPGTELVDASPEPIETDGQDVVFSEVLTSDMSFMVTYR
ncbi:MAG: DUF4012 domain-containing protein [Candidatus Promineifilaceae bacterium]